MAEYKNQHFVPRFYLANFGFNDGAQINLIRTATLKAIPRIGVTGQCQEDFFYGKNLKMERALSVIEGTCRKVISEILRDGRLAALGTSQDALLKTFICLQWIRTREFAANPSARMRASTSE